MTSKHLSVVRDGKGHKTRVTTLAYEPVAPLEKHLVGRKVEWERDCALGHGTVHLPYALAGKYSSAAPEWA